MDAITIADKCKRVAQSCCQAVHVEVTRNFVERALVKIEDIDPSNQIALDIIGDTLYQLEMECREGMLGNLHK